VLGLDLRTENRMQRPRRSCITAPIKCASALTSCRSVYVWDLDLRVWDWV